MKLISIFIPCYNEADNLRSLFERLFAVADANSKYEYEFVVSDNKSTDTSRKILEDIAARDSRVKLIYNVRNFGPGRSGAHGFFQTTGDASICLAADLQDPPELIPEFLSMWEQGNKVVLGRNPTSEEEASMKLFRGLYYKLLAHFSEHEEFDHVSGFGLYDKEVVELLRKEGNPNPNFRISVSELGYKPAFVDYEKPGRKEGRSSYSIGSYIDLTVDSFVSVSKKPLYMIIKSGAAASVLFAVVALSSLIAGLVLQSFELLLIALLLLVCVGCSLTVLVVGVSGMYSAMALEWVKERPLVIEERRINFDSDSRLCETIQHE